MRCLYVDLDGTLLGPDASLVTGADGRFSLMAMRALEACARAGVEVVPFSGRKQTSVWEVARLIACRAFIFEIGCGLMLDGELEWLTDGLEPSTDDGSIFDQITGSGAVDLLLSRFDGALEPHTPWSAVRDVSPLFRGSVDLDEANAALAAGGFDWLRLLDNGVIPEAGSLGLMPWLDVVRAYHLVPAGASKARAVARHMQARGYAAAECIACGDSREDLGATSVVGTFWLVANALERDPGLDAIVAGRPDVRVCAEGYGAGVYEAVVTTLAEGR
jgi:hypothetical protein